MKPVNKTERARAFLNFLLLFIISTGIVITMVFFSVEVPIKQNNDFRKQNYIVQRDRKFSYDFLTEMSGIVGMLDTINNTSKADFLEGDLKLRITKLKQKVDADSVYDKTLYQYIVQNLYDMQIAKNQLRNLTSKDNNVNELQTQNEKLTADLEQCKKENISLLLQSNQRQAK